MSRIVLRLLPAPHGTAEPEGAWWHEDRPDDIHPGLPPRGTVAAVLVPSEHVLLLGTPAVGRTAAQRARAVPYAIEEQLAVPVERLHVAWRPDGERLQVAVVERPRMAAWLQWLEAAGIEAVSLVPDVLTLPAPPEGQAHLRVLDDGRALLRMGPEQAFAGTTDEVVAVLAATAPPPGTLYVDGGDAPSVARILAAVQGCAARIVRDAGAGAAPPAEGCLDLLQGDYAPQRRTAAVRTTWRWAAVLAAAAVLLGIGTLATERHLLAREVAAQRTEMEALYRRAAPQATRVVDPAVQLRAAADGAAAAADPALALLARAAPALAAEACCDLDALDYRAGALELTLVAEDLAGLDRLRGALAGAAGHAELTQATPGSRGVEGRIRIGGTP